MQGNVRVSHHPNPRKLQPRRISRLIHDFEHFRSAKWKRWPDCTSPRTSMEPRNEKEHHLNHPLPFWASSRWGWSCPRSERTGRENPQKTGSQRTNKLWFFANLTTSIKQVPSARNRKLLFVHMNPMFFTSLDTSMYVDYGSSRACQKLVQICRSCFAFKKRPSGGNKASNVGMFLVVETQAGTQPRPRGT